MINRFISIAILLSVGICSADLYSSHILSGTQFGLFKPYFFAVDSGSYYRLLVIYDFQSNPTLLQQDSIPTSTSGNQDTIASDSLFVLKRDRSSTWLLVHDGNLRIRMRDDGRYQVVYNTYFNFALVRRTRDSLMSIPTESKSPYHKFPTYHKFIIEMRAQHLMERKVFDMEPSEFQKAIESVLRSISK